MRCFALCVTVSFSLISFGCPVTPNGGAIALTFDFSDGDNGWDAGWADYRIEDEDLLQLEAGIRDLPDDLNTDGTGFYIQGLNSPDDLFMFLKRRLGPDEGIAAGRTYEVRYTIRVASNAPTGCFGVGGSPGESVYLKAGASGREPEPVPDSQNTLRMNIDIGNQAEGGANASVVGTIGNGLPCEDYPDPSQVPYVSLVREHTHTTDVAADEEGTIWLIVGTDSGYESVTALYYQRIDVELTPADASP